MSAVASASTALSIGSCLHLSLMLWLLPILRYSPISHWQFTNQ